VFNARAEQLGALSLRHALSAFFHTRGFAAGGGYGTSFLEGFRIIGGYTGRILHGEKPADLPVQQSTKVQLIINLMTAKALGLTIPLSLLGRAGGDRIGFFAATAHVRRWPFAPSHLRVRVASSTTANGGGI
jgi:hypothetical protein